MTISVNDLQTDLNTYLGDPTTARISAAQRLSAITEATVWLQESLRNEHLVQSYVLNYYDSVNAYKVTSVIGQLLEASDMRRDQQDQIIQWAFKDAREIVVDIAQNSTEEAYAIDRHDSNTYLLINHQTYNKSQIIALLATTTDGGGTWFVDSTNSTATNLRVDTITYQAGPSSLAFDTLSSQTANLRATIENTTLAPEDYTQYQNSGSFILWVYLPYITNVSSCTLYWGSDISDYWSTTVTTDLNNNALAVGWNRLRFDWTASSQTGSPVITEMTYIRFDINFSSNATKLAYRVNELLLCNPEQLTFFYTSWNVGTNNSGTAISAFTATTDVPYFSGLYDQYRYAVSHMAAAILFATPLRLMAESEQEEEKAVKALTRAKEIVPMEAMPETRTFRAQGVRFARRWRAGGRR